MYPEFAGEKVCGDIYFEIRYWKDNQLTDELPNWIHIKPFEADPRTFSLDIYTNDLKDAGVYEFATWATW